LKVKNSEVDKSKSKYQPTVQVEAATAVEAGVVVVAVAVIEIAEEATVAVAGKDALKTEGEVVVEIVAVVADINASLTNTFH
jgi:hypothetical protein